jgi:hypothetical protein
MSGWKDPLIRAGVACPAFVKEKEGLYPSFFFRYRRPGPVECEHQHKQFSACTGDPDKLVATMQSFVSAWITEWSVSDPCDAAHVKMLTHPLLLKIYFIIVQSDPSAEIPAEFLGDGETGSAEGEQKK